MSILVSSTLTSTKLFVRLKELEDAGMCPMGLSGNVASICHEAAERLKYFPALHRQFTLHDETHCLRVTHLMAMVADSVLYKLNAIEIALLILSAYFHDQGMIVDAHEMKTIKASTEWKLYEQNWISDHPNYGEANTRLSDPLITSLEKNRTIEIIDELNAAMFTEYIRQRHGERSVAYLQHTYRNDRRLELFNRTIVDLLGTICLSHVKPAESITASNGFRFDELVGNVKVNAPLLAYILRLADILDFDRERTPDSLYKAIQFTSPVSLEEWEKHRSIIGWEISGNRIVIAAECSHPAYERAIRNFLDWIDNELTAVRSWGLTLPAEFVKDRLNLPERVDRSRVGPMVDPVSRQPAYNYFDLEITLSRNEVVKLLMTTGLYNNKSLFIRELLQNGLDALRHRQALYLANSMDTPKLEVSFEHVQENGIDVVRCTDNGVGMNETIIERFLTRAGRSYYRSPEFEQERVLFREKGCDFDPCARFGIGFMSCFMFGDDVIIRTRRDYGMGHEHGPPLIVEIRGLSGIIVVRPGLMDQKVGTTVEVHGRRKSFIVDEWTDPVNLIAVLEGYAIAAEFPVYGSCKIKNVEGQTTISPQAMSRPDALEAIESGTKETFAVDLSSSNPLLRGEIRVCTLIDAYGVPSISNETARVSVRKTGESKSSIRRFISIENGQENSLDSNAESLQVCCDGILVAGSPGRDERVSRLGWSSCNYNFGNAAFLIDARGNLKPELTPARTPVRESFRQTNRSWGQLFSVAGKAYSELLNQIVQRCSTSEQPVNNQVAFGRSLRHID